MNQLSKSLHVCLGGYGCRWTNLIFFVPVYPLPLVNAELKHLVHWLNANKISRNVKKTEMVIFKSKQKKVEGDLKIKLCGKRLYPN